MKKTIITSILTVIVTNYVINSPNLQPYLWALLFVAIWLLCGLRTFQITENSWLSYLNDDPKEVFMGYVLGPIAYFITCNILDRPVFKTFRDSFEKCPYKFQSPIVKK